MRSRRRLWGLAVALVVLLGGGWSMAQAPRAGGAPTVPEMGARGVALSPLEEALEVQLEADGELLWELAGGLRGGSSLDAAAQAAVSMDTAPLGLWSGGRLLGSLIAIRGGNPDARLVGDLQVTSNIVAPTAFRIYELWYRQRLAGLPLALRAGLIDLNQYFAVADTAADLLNSSFGIMPAISANAATSIYPKPGFGAMLDGGSRRRQLLVGVFQGNPADRPSALRGGAMAIAEVKLHGRGASGDVLKLGVWRHSAPSADARTPGRAQWGVYGIGEGEIGGAAGRTWRGFVQLGATPPGGSLVPAYLGAGVTVAAPLGSRPDDTVTVGLARAWIRHASAETSYEVTYVASLGAHLQLQPDLQLVTHPSGSRTVPDAVVGALRLHWSN